jgi:antitoxin (DNA-binding transcriptional repressor) of toxin-antitoxin stability system
MPEGATAVFNLDDADGDLQRLVERALQGEEVVIARDGVPAVRLVQVKGAGMPKRKGGFLKGQIVETDPDWWRPDDELADLFEGKESHDDELLGLRSPKGR